MRSSWDEVNELIASANVYTAKTFGPDRVIGFSPVANPSKASPASFMPPCGKPLSKPTYIAPRRSPSAGLILDGGSARVFPGGDVLHQRQALGNQRCDLARAGEQVERTGSTRAWSIMWSSS